MMKFRKQTKLFPGVRLNVSKSGISTTIGGKGASINVGKKGTYLNTGIPGTGIYNRQKIGQGRKKEKGSPDNKNEDMPINPLANEEIEAIKTEEAESTTTEDLQDLQDLQDLKKTLLACYETRIHLKKEIKKANLKYILATLLLGLSYILIFGFFTTWVKDYHEEKKGGLNDLKTQLKNCHVNIDMDIDEQIEKEYLRLIKHYKTLLSCSKIWDITSSVDIDKKRTRSAASSSVTRRPVKFGFENIDIIECKYDALHFENANGGDIYIYPPFIAIVDGKKKFGLVDIRELNFNFRGQRFLEEEKIPNDAKVVDQTWAKVNKNGSRDKRFKDNYQIPVCLYGEIELTSDTGLNEVYSLSSYRKCEDFANAMISYQGVVQ